MKLRSLAIACTALVLVPGLALFTACAGGQGANASDGDPAVSVDGAAPSTTDSATDSPRSDGRSSAGDASKGSDDGGAAPALGEDGGSDAGLAPEASNVGPSGSDSGIVDAAAAAGKTVVRVHYPAGSHTITVRGAGGGLNWTTGQTTSASGDTFSYTLAGVTSSTEWKPLLDDTTWAIGPNYHVMPGQTVDVWPHFTTMTGQVQTLIADFHSTTLNDDRAVYVYYPASYFENTDATYPVVYMHDGQNLWAALPSIAFSGTWNVDTAFDNASVNGACSAGGVAGWGAQPLGGTATTCTSDTDCSPGEGCATFPEAIVIGVANNGNRVLDYTPTVDPSEDDAGLGPQGGADAYIAMLINELKPKIDAMLRTRPDVASTAMAGSSLGGLVTAYAGLKRPDVFGRLAELSPSTWWDADVIVGDVQGTLPAPNRPLVVYVDSGQGDADDESDTDQLAAAYLALGYVNGTNFRHVVQSGAQHNETYWAERFPGAMQLVLGVR